MAEFVRAINKQDTVVTISDTSRIQGGNVGDTVSIDTVISLNSPEPQEITLVLPSISGDSQKAYLRTLQEIENRQEFQSPVDLEQLDAMTEEQRKEIEGLIAANKEQWELIKEKTNQVSLNTVNLEAGSQELKFFLQKEINPRDGIYELSFIAPQSNFSVNQSPFTMSVIIILPRDAKLISQEVVSPDGLPSAELRSSDTQVNRHILQYWMQYDPIFTIRYQY